MWNTFGLPIYSKNPLKSIFSRTTNQMAFKLGKTHQGLKCYKVYINDDPGLTLAYFITRSTVQLGFYMGNSWKNIYIYIYKINVHEPKSLNGIQVKHMFPKIKILIFYVPCFQNYICFPVPLIFVFLWNKWHYSPVLHNFALFPITRGRASLEVPQWGLSNEYPQHMFLWIRIVWSYAYY